MQHVVVFVGPVLGGYLQHDEWWVLFLGLCTLWLYRLPNNVSGRFSLLTPFHIKK